MLGLACSLAFADPAPPQDGNALLEVPLGRSLVVTLPQAPLAVAVTDPNVAIVQPLGSATVLQVQGKKIGTTDFVMTFPGGKVEIFDVVVQRDLSELVRVLDHIVEGGVTVTAPR